MRASSSLKRLHESLPRIRYTKEQFEEAVLDVFRVPGVSRKDARRVFRLLDGQLAGCPHARQGFVYFDALETYDPDRSGGTQADDAQLASLAAFRAGGQRSPRPWARAREREQPTTSTPTLEDDEAHHAGRPRGGAALHHHSHHFFKEGLRSNSVRGRR